MEKKLYVVYTFFFSLIFFIDCLPSLFPSRLFFPTDTWNGGPQASTLQMISSDQWNPNTMRHSAGLGVWKSCGWHMSFFMSPEKIVQKIQSFSHPEYNKAPFTSVAYIIQKIKQGEDIFGRHWENMISAKGSPLPRLVMSNPEYFSHFLV